MGLAPNLNSCLSTEVPASSQDMAAVLPAGGAIAAAANAASNAATAASASADRSYCVERDAAPAGELHGQVAEAPPQALDWLATMAVWGCGCGFYSYCYCCTPPPVGRGFLATLASMGRGSGPCAVCGCRFCAAPGEWAAVCGYCLQMPALAAAVDREERFKGWLPW